MSGVRAPERQNLGLFYTVTLCFNVPLLVLYNSVKYFPSGLFKLCLCCLQHEVIAPAATLLRSVTFTMEAVYKGTWTHQCIKVLLLLFNFLSVWLHRRWEMWNCIRTEQLTENLQLWCASLASWGWLQQQMEHSIVRKMLGLFKSEWTIFIMSLPEK